MGKYSTRPMNKVAHTYTLDECCSISYNTQINTIVYLDIKRGPGAVAKAACLESSNPALAFKFPRNKMFLPRSLVKIQYCSIFEFCFWRAVSSHSSHHLQDIILVQFSLNVQEGGLKPHSFHLIYLNIKVEN